MTRSRPLGEFEHLVLLAILRLGDEAYAPAILEELETRTGRPPSPGSMYVTLDRLEEKGLLRSRLADATDPRGGRPRRYVSVTPLGVRQLRESRTALLKLWRGLEGVLENP
ncbi:MAG TPA: PadR family transcriptional regulator [Gemmatimonadaceae bacterium]